MGKFETLTKYIRPFKDGGFGDWVIDRENDGTLEHPIHMPFVNYPEWVDRFVDDVCKFVDVNEDMALSHYYDILKDNGLEWGLESMKNADATLLDSQCAMALIVGAVRAEHFCEGALLSLLQSGCVIRWLERLQDFDMQENEYSLRP